LRQQRNSLEDIYSESRTHYRQEMDDYVPSHYLVHQSSWSIGRTALVRLFISVVFTHRLTS